MQSYFANEYDELTNIFSFNKEDSYHLVNVLRTKINTTLIVTYQGKKYQTTVIVTKPLLKTKMITPLKENNELAEEITLLMPLLQNNRNDWIIQKATELGVHKIIPLHLTHSVVQITEQNKLNNKIKRWEKIAKEASQQSNRNKIPLIVNCITRLSTNELKKYENNLNIVANELNPSSTTLDNLLMKKPTKITLICGPEGGFSQKELSLLKLHNFWEINLGKRILRSETAMLTILANISYFLESRKERENAQKS